MDISLRKSTRLVVPGALVTAAVVALAVPTRTSAATATPSLIGCYADKGDNNPTPENISQLDRDLNGAVRHDGSNTVENCISMCTDKGFAYAGVQYGSWCFCGNQYGKYGTSKECSRPCAGDRSETCGGVWANDVYALTAGGGGDAGMACPSHTMSDAISGKWQQLGGASGILGCPRTDEADAPASPAGSRGRVVEFSGSGGGLILNGTAGAAANTTFEVHGCAFKVYDQLGRSSSYLGFPTSDEHDTPGGRRSDFEGGYVLWNASNRKCQAFASGTGPGVPGGPGASAIPYTEMPTEAGAPSGAVSLEFVGVDSDKTKNWDYGPAGGGAADGHWRITLSGALDIASIDLYALDANGNKTIDHWSTKDRSFFILAVEASGMAINKDHVATLGMFPAGTVLDAWGSQGQTTFGAQKYEIDLVTSDGTTITVTSGG